MILLIIIIMIGLAVDNTHAQSVSRIYLELKSNSKNITCNNTDECEYTTITKNSPFDILAIRQTGLTITANSEHYYEIVFNVNSFIPLGSEEWYFNEPIFRVINSSGTKYDVTCKSKTWSLVEDFTQLGDTVYRSYRYACNWDTTGEYVGVELVMDTQPYDGFNTTFTGVKVNAWTYTDSIGAGAIIENQNQNTDMIINNQNQNQQQTNDRLDNILSGEEYVKPDKNEDIENMENAEQEIFDLFEYNPESVTINIDDTSTRKIFELLSRIITQNNLIQVMVITILSISIIKLVLGR